MKREEDSDILRECESVVFRKIHEIQVHGFIPDGIYISESLWRSVTRAMQMGTWVESRPLENGRPQWLGQTVYVVVDAFRNNMGERIPYLHVGMKLP